MRLTIALYCFLCTIGFAKDKKEETKPTPDPILVIDLVKAQRDYANLARQATPITIELERREKDLADKNAKLQAQCGEVTKWKFNPVNCECEEVKQPAPTPAAPTVPEPKKDN